MSIIYCLTKELNLSYSDFNNMNFFEILNILEVYEENMKEQHKQQEKEESLMKKQMNQMQNNYKFNDLQKQYSNNNYQPPSMPKFDIPKF
jgi:glutamyl-tRNA reductase